MAARCVRLAWQPDSGLRILHLHQSTGRVALDFTTPFGSRPYQFEATLQLGPDRWAPVPDVVIRPTGGATYRAECSGETAAARFYRLAVPP